MRLSPLMFPDRCTIRPMTSIGHGPGAEDDTGPGTPISGVICFVQDLKDKDVALSASRGREVMTEIYFRDDDDTREALRALEEDSVIEVTYRGGVELPEAVNAVVSRSEVDTLNGLAIWRVDCKTRV